MQSNSEWNQLLLSLHFQGLSRMPAMFPWSFVSSNGYSTGSLMFISSSRQSRRSVWLQHCSLWYRWSRFLHSWAVLIRISWHVLWMKHSLKYSCSAAAASTHAGWSPGFKWHSGVAAAGMDPMDRGLRGAGLLCLFYGKHVCYWKDMGLFWPCYCYVKSTLPPVSPIISRSQSMCVCLH